jgi:hypothetical protein
VSLVADVLAFRQRLQVARPVNVEQVAKNEMGFGKKCEIA